jgi:HKD family nuclease
MIRLGPIVNGRITNTGCVLCEWMRDRGCQEVALASAYVTNGGLRRLYQSLRTLVQQRGRKCRILTGVKDCFTDPEALAGLARLSKNSSGRLTVKVSRNSRFHAKLYLIQLGKRSVALTGSANITADGMGLDGEFSVEIEGPSTDSIWRRFWRWFEEEFSNAHEVDERFLEVYSGVHKRVSAERAHGIDDRLPALLRAVFRRALHFALHEQLARLTRTARLRHPASGLRQSTNS